jgi:muramoyltetrapeptide carboxypeptidase
MARSSVRFPAYLKKGDVIGVTCPAGHMPLEKVGECVRVLSDLWGFGVRVGHTVGSSYNYFSGTDDERLADLQTMLDDPDIKAILFGRGGYGLGRIIDRLNFRKFRKNPKWLIGFSDITVIHSHVFTRYGIATIHAPMANAFNEGGYKGPFVRSLHDALLGKKAGYRKPKHKLDRVGRATGQLVGGNLALVAHLCGTRSAFHTTGRILFLEDVGEYLYNIDRMMYQLKRSGMLDGLAGLVFGGFTEMKDTTQPFGKDIWATLHDIVAEYDFPVCFDFPISHGNNNYAVKIGGTYTLDVGPRGSKLTEH